MEVEDFIKAISPLLKKYGFKKSNSTWRRNQSESIAVLNVQKSQWGGGKFYINLGAYFREFGSEQVPTENRCHVRVRLQVNDPSNTVDSAIAWFDARATLEGAKGLAKGDSEKGLVFKELLNGIT